MASTVIFSIKVLVFGSKDYTKEQKTVEYTGFLGQTIAGFDQLGLGSDPEISSKLRNGINDPNKK